MSPRPKKIRRCEGNFCGRAFKPTGTPLINLKQITLFRDELEALKLCDYEDYFRSRQVKKWVFPEEQYNEF